MAMIILKDKREQKEPLFSHQLSLHGKKPRAMNDTSNMASFPMQLKKKKKGPLIQVALNLTRIQQR